MSDSGGILSKEQENAIRAALAQKLPGRLLRCPICNGDLNLLDGFFSLIANRNMKAALNLTGTKTLFAAIALRCSHCGHLMLFEAGPLGISHLFDDAEGAK
jgi:hypothetical protein